MTKLFVLLGDTGAWVAPMGEAIRAAGCRVGLVAGPCDPVMAGELAAEVDEFTTVRDLADPVQVAAAAHALASNDASASGEPAAIVSLADGAVVAAARAAELLGIGRTPSMGIELARNKYACRSRLAEAGLPVPGFALMHEAADAERLAVEVGLPAVIKPINGAGSHLVEPVHTADELADAYRRSVEGMRTTVLGHLYAHPLAGVDPTRSFLVEGMLRGQEYTVDVVVRDGATEQIALAHKAILDDRFFEHGFITPPIDLDPEAERAIRAAAVDAVRVLGLDNTLAHIELIDDGLLGPTIVEVNPGRPAGQILTNVYAINTGVHMFTELVAVALGIPTSRTDPELRIPLGVVSVFPEKTGRLRAVHGLDDVAALPDVAWTFPLARPGDLITEEYESWAVGVIVAGFADTDDLRDTQQEVARLVRLEMEP